MPDREHSGAAPPRQSACKQCGTTFCPHGRNPCVYCSMACKAAWQRTQKLVDRDWLFEKYVEEGRSANDIARIVGRDPKRVLEWLWGYGIPTRSRGHNYADHPAFAYWLHGTDNPFKGKRHSEQTRSKLRDVAIADGRVPYDPAVGSYMKGRRGADAPNWKGGVTPERQAFYASEAWRAAARAVYARDRATCQRCGLCRNDHRDVPFDIHHIVSFAYAPLRCEVSNLVLLCERCHYWVHSRENTEGRFIQPCPSANK